MILAVFLALADGLWRLQVGRNDEYQVRADQNRIRASRSWRRGEDPGREGNLIVDNYPSFSALPLRDQLRDLNADGQKLLKACTFLQQMSWTKSARRNLRACLPAISRSRRSRGPG